MADERVEVSRSEEKSLPDSGDTMEDEDAESGDDIYEVEKIVGMSKKEGKTLYRVRWVGYGSAGDTWEPLENLETCKDMIDAYLEKCKKKKDRRLSKESITSDAVSTDVVSPEEGSSSSERNEPEKQKQRKPTYYYVTSDDDKADTLKDKFWRDLEQGKINVFTGDMYSKVKGQGRISRPTSFCNTSNDDSEKETPPRNIGGQKQQPIKKPKKVKKVERVKNGAMKHRRRRMSTTSDSSQSTIPLKISSKATATNDKGKGKRPRGSSAQQTQKKPRLETSLKTPLDKAVDVAEAVSSKDDYLSETASEFSSSVTIGAGSVSLDSNSVVGSVIVKDEPPESVGSYPDTIQQLNDLDVKAELDALDETDYTTNIKEIPCDPVAMETNYSVSNSPDVTPARQMHSDVEGSDGVCHMKSSTSQQLFVADPKLRSCVVVMKAISDEQCTDDDSKAVEVPSSGDGECDGPASPGSHITEESDHVVTDCHDDDDIPVETNYINSTKVINPGETRLNPEDKPAESEHCILEPDGQTWDSLTSSVMGNGSHEAKVESVDSSKAVSKDQSENSKLLHCDGNGASSVGNESLLEEATSENRASGGTQPSSVQLQSKEDCGFLQKNGLETVANLLLNSDSSICDNKCESIESQDKSAINRACQDMESTHIGLLHENVSGSNDCVTKSRAVSHVARVNNMDCVQDSPVEVHFEMSYELSDISDADASPAGMIADKSDNSHGYSCYNTLRTAELLTTSQSPAQQITTVSADEGENENGTLSQVANDKTHPSQNQTHQTGNTASADGCLSGKVDSNQNVKDVMLDSSCSLIKCDMTATTAGITATSIFAGPAENLNRNYSNCAQTDSTYHKPHSDKAHVMPPSPLAQNTVMRTSQTIANVTMTSNDCHQIQAVSSHDGYSLVSRGGHAYPSFVHTTAPPSYTASVSHFTAPSSGLHSGNSPFAPPPPPSSLNSMNLVASHHSNTSVQQSTMYPHPNHCLKTEISDPRTSHDLHSSSPSSCQVAGLLPKEGSSNLIAAITSCHAKGFARDDAVSGFDLDDVDPVAWERKIPTHHAQSNCDSLELTNAELRQAVRENSYNRVRQALTNRRKYDLEQPDGAGITLVVMAAHSGFDDMLELLAVHGANINARQKNGATPLIKACEVGHRCTVELLLAMGAHVNVQQSNGETALMKAVKEGNKHIVQRLLEYGANFAMQSTSENTAIKYAKLMNRSQVLEILKTHISRVTADFESQVYITLNNTARIKCALFPVQCFALNESDRHMVVFNHDLQPTKPGVGMLLFMAHAKFTLSETKCRFYGPCAVTNALLNSVPLHPLTEEANFVMSFVPLHHGRNVLEIQTVRAPKSRAKLVVCAYKAQLTMPPD